MLLAPLPPPRRGFVSGGWTDLRRRRPGHLIGNTASDRLIDWSGNFNAFVVLFHSNGAPAIVRSHNPSVVEFLIQLSRSDGADQTRIQTAPWAPTPTSRPSHDAGDDYGELGLSLEDEIGGDFNPLGARHRMLVQRRSIE